MLSSGQILNSIHISCYLEANIHVDTNTCVIIYKGLVLSSSFPVDSVIVLLLLVIPLAFLVAVIPV